MIDFHEMWYESEDGLRLFARDYPCLDNKRPGDPTIVCIPGLTRNSADFHALCFSLQKRFRVIAVDLRGRGRSDYDSEPANYQPLSYVKDVQTLIAKLELDRVVFIGTSLGGLVSLLIGAQKPAWLQALIINDFGPELDQAGLDRIKSYVGKSPPVRNWSEAVAQCKATNGTELPDLSEAQWLTFARNVFRQDASGRPVLAYDPAIARPFENNEAKADASPLWAAFEALPAVPILVIRGAISDLLSSDCVAQMQGRRNDLRCMEVPNRGHAPLLNEPVALAAIESLLSSLRE